MEQVTDDSELHSVMIRHHDLGDGVFAIVRRVLRGTDNSRWGGTQAYKTGIDIMVSIYCRECAINVQDVDDLTGLVSPEFRVHYDKADKGAWYDAALVVAKRHSLQAHPR